MGLAGGLGGEGDEFVCAEALDVAASAAADCPGDDGVRIGDGEGGAAGFDAGDDVAARDERLFGAGENFGGDAG